MKRKLFSYWWPEPPPPGFEQWVTTPNIHNQWRLYGPNLRRSKFDGQPTPDAWLLRRCRNKIIRYQVRISHNLATRMEWQLGDRWRPIESPWLPADKVTAWWVTLQLTGEGAKKKKKA